MNDDYTPLFDEKDADERGVVVMEVGYMPIDEKQHFQSDALLVGICLSGSASCIYDMQNRDIGAHDIGVFLPNRIWAVRSASRDYRALGVIVSKAFYERLIQRKSFVDYKKYYYQPLFHLTDEQFEQLVDVMRVTKAVSESDLPKRIEMLEDLSDIFFSMVSHFRGDKDARSEKKNRNEKLFSRFYDMLIENYVSHHDLAWYAQQLSLSPKYFSRPIFQATGKSAFEWINTVLVIQAKRLLRTRHDMTVQQVAYALGFQENATFCRFFKQQTGLTPSEYRKGE